MQTILNVFGIILIADFIIILLPFSFLLAADTVLEFRQSMKKLKEDKKNDSTRNRKN